MSAEERSSVVVAPTTGDDDNTTAKEQQHQQQDDEQQRFIRATLGEMTEIESMCPKCEANGKTRLMITDVPFFKKIIVSSFSCDKCGESNTETTFGGEYGPKRTRHHLHVKVKEDMGRQVVKSEHAVLRIPELELELPSETQKGSLNTVEGIIAHTIEGLKYDQPVRKIMQPEFHDKIEEYCVRLESFRSGETPFSLIIDDPAGNSFIEPRYDYYHPTIDPSLSLFHFTRTDEDRILLGLATKDTIDEEKKARRMERRKERRDAERQKLLQERRGKGETELTLEDIVKEEEEQRQQRKAAKKEEKKKKKIEEAEKKKANPNNNSEEQQQEEDEETDDADQEEEEEEDDMEDETEEDRRHRLLQAEKEAKPQHPTRGALGSKEATAIYNTLRTKEEEKKVTDGEMPDVFELREACPACHKDSVIKMHPCDIPHFRQTIIMAFKCDHCGYKSTEIQTGGEVPDKGRRITLRVENESDLKRDVLKSNTASLEIPELELELVAGTLGGFFTTVEGLLMQVYDNLKSTPRAAFSQSVGGEHAGDSDYAARAVAISKDRDSEAKMENSMTTWLARLDDAVKGKVFPLTVIMDDPMAAIYVQNPRQHLPPPANADPQLTIDDYTRTDEQDEDLGLHQMVV